MTIRYSRRFVKQLSRQSAKVRKATSAKIKIFEKNPYEPSLRNHQLQGKFKGLYSINITGDIRAIYEIIGDEIYLYQMIGTHAQLYK